jgi:hypothetical protein
VGAALRSRWGFFVVLSLALTSGGVSVAEAATPGDLWVDGASSSCSDAFTRDQATAPATPWCTIVRAASAATAGDTVNIRPGRYVGSVRPVASGSAGSPTRYWAPEGGVTIDAAGASAAIKLVSVTDVAIDGITVTGAATQGVWTYGAQRITLDRLTVEGNRGPGIQIRDSVAVTVSRSVVQHNGGAGIFETSGSSGGRYVTNDIEANGINGDPYNGDGIQLGGTGAYVAASTIVGNGDPGPYEHGIYAAASASGYVIESNVLRSNAGSNIKAAGSAGVVRYNRLEGGRLGIVFSDNASTVVAYYNVISGAYQHAVLVTTDASAARARLWNNTIVVTSRSAASGDASAIFVKAATSLDLRNNLVSYANADNLGSAVYVLDATQVQSFTSNNNWFSTLESNARHLVWNGVHVTLAKWRHNGFDDKSIASTPPSFDASTRVTSTNLGRRRGQNLGLTRDIVGTPVPSGASPDIGAYQSV